MAPNELTEYERRRLENIKRNEEMLAALKIQSRATELSTISKRQRPQTKSYKASPEKKQKIDEPVVLRRSLRTRGVAPDASTACGIKDDFKETPTKMKPKANSESSPERLCRQPVPVSMRDAYRGDDSGQELIDLIRSLSREPEMSASDGYSDSTNFLLKKEEVEAIDSIQSFAKKEEAKGSDPDPNLLNKEEIGGYDSIRSVVKQEEAGDCDSVKNVVKKEEGGDLDLKRWVLGAVDLNTWDLKPENVARVVPGRILSVKLFPTIDKTLVVVGNKFGNVGFWNVDAEEEDNDGIYMYYPHSAPVSGIVIQPFSMSKMFTSSYDGFIRLMDVEREIFDLVYSGDYAVYSISGRPHDLNSLYFSEGSGEFDIWDMRAGKSPSTWNLHESRINTIDFNPSNTNLMATSSSDGTACIWDLRNINVDNPVPLKVVRHERAVHSAYFSPSGRFLATTSVDDNVGLSSGANFEDLSMINHNNQTGRWISTFRGIWGWDDSHLYIGSMKRGVDVVSVAEKKVVATLESENMTAIPCRFDAHRYRRGMLAGATSGGQVYVWTSS